MRRRSGRLNASRSPTFEGEVAGLIRRSPSLVRGRPYPSTDGSAAGFHFHQCPSTTAAVHPEWLPTWLSAEGADKGGRPRLVPHSKGASTGFTNVCRKGRFPKRRPPVADGSAGPGFGAAVVPMWYGVRHKLLHGRT